VAAVVVVPGRLRELLLLVLVVLAVIAVRCLVRVLVAVALRKPL
jgi:hypothetical protein